MYQANQAKRPNPLILHPETRIALYLVFGVLVIKLLIEAAFAFGLAFLAKEDGFRVVHEGAQFTVYLPWEWMGFLRFSDSEANGAAAIYNPQALAVAATLVKMLVKTLPLCYMVREIIKVSTKVTKETPFSPDCVRCLKNVGKTLILMGLLEKTAVQVAISAVGFHTLYFDNPIQFPILIVGALVFVLADIFGYGCELEKEVEETV